MKITTNWLKEHLDTKLKENKLLINLQTLVWKWRMLIVNQVN